MIHIPFFLQMRITTWRKVQLAACNSQLKILGAILAACMELLPFNNTENNKNTDNSLLLVQDNKRDGT